LRASKQRNFIMGQLCSSGPPLNGILGLSSQDRWIEIVYSGIKAFLDGQMELQ